MGVINWRTLRDGPNVMGQARGFMAITPVVPGQEADLRAYLEGLPQADSPLARLPGTHFARFMVVDRLEPEGERDPDRLLCSMLVFTACYDGAQDPFLDALGRELTVEAREIWGRCVGCSETSGAALKNYLLHNQINSGFFVSGYKDASLPAVRRALANREKVIDLAVRGQTMVPGALRRAFESELGGE
jgi:hypothetical protein